MRAAAWALAIVALAAFAAWGLPALDTGATRSAFGCEAEGLGRAECTVSCEGPEDLQIWVEVNWGWGVTKARGEATCGDSTRECTTGASVCVTGRFVGGNRTPLSGEGTCRGWKLPSVIFPGSVRVSCSTE